MMKQALNKYILYWVEQTLYSGVDIDELVKTVGYSRRTLEKIFWQEHQQTLGQYIFKRKMTRAAITLWMTKLSVTEIALQLNYYSGQNFARAFRRYFGKSPTAYRKSHVWDSTFLQMSLLHLMPEFKPSTIVLENPRTISGKEVNYLASYIFIEDQSFTKHVKPLIDELSQNGIKDIWVAASLSKTDTLSSNRNGLIHIQAITGEMSTCNSSDEKPKSIIPAGQYASFIFSGTWSEFIIYSRQIYIKTFSNHNLHWLGKTCFINFNTLNKEQDKVECNFLIPVVNMKKK